MSPEEVEAQALHDEQQSHLERLRIITADAIAVVNMFDQANTNSAVVRLGSRGRLLAWTIKDLRASLNQGGQITLLSAEQAGE